MIIIPYWHGESYLPSCLESITNSHFDQDIDLTVVIIHNGGPYPNVPAGFDKTVVILETRKDIGFARAVNVGLDYGFSHQGDFIALLNHDTRLDKDCLQLLLKAAISTPALYSPLVMNYDMLSLPNLGASKYHPHVDLNSLKAQYELHLMNGACILGTYGSFVRGGYFDTIFRMYYEDDDYSKRFIERGGKLYLINAAKVGHVGRSTEAFGGSTILTRRTSSLKYMFRHNSVWAVLSKMMRDYGSFVIRFQIHTLLRCIGSDIHVFRLWGYLKNADYDKINKRAVEMVGRDLFERRQ